MAKSVSPGAEGWPNRDDGHHPPPAGDRALPATQIPRVAYTIQETAAALGVSTDLVYDLCARGELKAIRAGRRKLIRADSLDLWIRNQTLDES